MLGMHCCSVHFQEEPIYIILYIYTYTPDGNGVIPAHCGRIPRASSSIVSRRAYLLYRLQMGMELFQFTVDEFPEQASA